MFHASSIGTELNSSSDLRSPEPLTPAFDSEWYLHVAGQNYGPFGSQQLKAFAAEGRINAQSVVFRKGGTSWEPICKDSVIGSVLYPPRPPVPPFAVAELPVTRIAKTEPLRGTVIRTEKHVRGFFGKFVKWGFIVFNVLMLIWLVLGLNAIGNFYDSAGSSAEQAGAAIGGAIGASMVIGLWAFGDIVLGLLVLFTRGKKVIVEEADA